MTAETRSQHTPPPSSEQYIAALQAFKADTQLREINGITRDSAMDQAIEAMTMIQLLTRLNKSNAARILPMYNHRNIS